MSTSNLVFRFTLALLALVASPVRGRALGRAIVQKTGLWPYGGGQ